MEVKEALSSYGHLMSGEQLERRTQQIYSWLREDKPIHDGVEDICVPDFSCCAPVDISPTHVREVWFRAIKAKDTTTTGAIHTFWADRAVSQMGYPIQGPSNRKEIN